MLVELLNFCSEHGEQARRGAVAQVEGLLNDADIEIVPQEHDSFLAAFALYKSRPDKGYSLTDCISMKTMEKRGITDVLTHDNHFAQEGFRVLF